MLRTGSITQKLTALILLVSGTVVLLELARRLAGAAFARA